VIPVRKGAVKILDFDIENRPLSYWVPDMPTAEITSIAACFTDDPESLQVWLLRPAITDADHEAQMRAMVTGFRAMYDRADMVTGHYITRHDLPIINAACVEWGVPLLEPKLTEDTKVHLLRFSDIPKTQESLSDLMGIFEKKVHMKQSMWRQANRLTVEGLAATESRVRGDVVQHMKLRVALREAGLLRAPRVWRP
jgi:hypothetical protein